MLKELTSREYRCWSEIFLQGLQDFQKQCDFYPLGSWLPFKNLIKIIGLLQVDVCEKFCMILFMYRGLMNLPKANN